jgi:hypothetical protein
LKSRLFTFSLSMGAAFTEHPSDASIPVIVPRHEQHRNSRPSRLRVTITFLAMSMAICELSSSCANPHAILQLTTPSSATAGSPFTVTVIATINGKPDTIINSPVHFTSSDPAALLPPDYYFSRADAGSHTFTNGFTLMTPGTQTISGGIHDAAGIKGSATIAVAP